MLRLIEEEPLGADAAERPTREAVEALWRATVALPIPDYPRAVLRRLIPRERR